MVRRPRAAGYRAEVIAPSKSPTMPGPEAKSDRLDCRKPAVFAQEGRLQPVRVPEEREEADRRVVRLRERLARKLRVAQQQIKAFLLQHGIAEPAGLTHGTAASVDALRRRELDAELRFRLDVMLDERRHAREQVARATRRPEELAGADRHREAVATLRTVLIEAAWRWVAGDEAARRGTAGRSPPPATARRPSWGWPGGWRS